MEYTIYTYGFRRKYRRLQRVDVLEEVYNYKMSIIGHRMCLQGRRTI